MTEKIYFTTLENSFDALAIRSHLDIRDLIEKIEPGEESNGTRMEKYILKNGFGEVIMNCSKYSGIIFMTVSEEVPVEIREKLKEICNQYSLKRGLLN